ncbi:GntR family transcriptional regulator [Phytoactinopolyspora mesophila]|uniref:GntR family transcriptional regulator n=1 Tax=Phytoactinopolyspora mesophila TaxID=2650750 RepID=A0A7K3M0S8_9ACTN|nr:GntR family transcriptional regulator [Phytoactinopolyspora mesophila]NDL56637.1 GntR family transcriptional regulator [Phytoactinopolyspora mesophila]
MLLWRQVAEDILAEIDSGALRPGDKLPSESDLASSYGVSRITVRRAIKELRQEKKVRVVQGRGTYVETND